MAKLSIIKRILKEDYPKEYGDLVEKLGFVLNPFLNSVADAFNKSLSINDNLNATDTEIVFTAPVTAATPVSVKTEHIGVTRGITVLRVDNLTNNNEILTQSPFCQFKNINLNQLQITNITGLTSGNKYRLRVLMLP